MKETSTGKNVFIEYMRFLFSITILFWHMRALSALNLDTYFCKSGSCAVEFFAVLSGFLLAKSMARYDEGSVIDNALHLMKRKWHSIFVMNAVALLFAIIVRQAVLGDSFSKMLNRLIENAVPELLFLTSTGIKTSIFHYNGAAWYLSAMMLCMVFIVPIGLRFPKLFRFVCFPCGILALGLLMQLDGTILATDSKYYGVLCLGNLRILGELLIGCASYFVYVYIKKGTKGLACLRLISLAGFLGYFWLCFHGIEKTWGPALVIMLGALFVCAFLGFDGWGTHNALFTALGMRLGKFSLALYLSHRYWIVSINALHFNMDARWQIVLCTVLSICSALVLEKLSAFILKRLPAQS